MQIRCFKILAIVFLIVPEAMVFACPTANGFPDFNCDRLFAVSFFGDSITRGKTDPLYNGTSGSVPLRINEYFKANLPPGSFKVLNFGTPGIDCKHLKADARHQLLRDHRGVAESDMIVFACGLNDFLTHKDPNLTKQYLMAMKRFSKRRGIFSVVAMLTQTSSPALQAWVAGVNKQLAILGRDLRYDLLNPQTMIGPDKLHPNGLGYSFLFHTFLHFVTGPSIKPQGEIQLGLKDSDTDDVYDSFELSKFGTDPFNPDTDGDGFEDGQEIFSLGTDPLIHNTTP